MGELVIKLATKLDWVLLCSVSRLMYNLVNDDGYTIDR